MKQCECGCGSVIKGDRRFVSGHNARIAPPSKKGRIPWNKGKQLSQEHKDNLSRSHFGNTSAKGWIPSAKTRELWSEQRKGAKAWNKGLTGYKTVPCSKEKAEKISLTHKKLWKDPIFAKRRATEFGIKPNKTEIAILNLLEKLYPNEWKYTGDFSFIINGKCPDFTNVNGQKKLIELFGDYWHRGENPQDRIDIFKPFGYETLVIWEHELKNKNKLIGKIQRFYDL